MSHELAECITPTRIVKVNGPIKTYQANGTICDAWLFSVCDHQWQNTGEGFMFFQREYALAAFADFCGLSEIPN